MSLALPFYFAFKLFKYFQDVLWQMYRFPGEGDARVFSLKGVSMAIWFAVWMFHKKINSRPTINIFYATETGTAKRFADKLKKKFATAFNVKFLQMKE